jgi:hypothetical protein
VAWRPVNQRILVAGAEVGLLENLLLSRRGITLTGTRVLVLSTLIRPSAVC